MMRSLLRPTMNSAPSASCRARSPVRSQPVARDRRGGCLRIAIVAVHHVRSANPQFADRTGVDVAPGDVDDAHFHAGDRRANGCVCARRVQPRLRHRGRSFRQSVAVVQREPEPAFDRALQRGIERRPARIQIAQMGRGCARVGRQQLEHAGVHRRHALHDGQAVRDRIERAPRVEARHHVQAGARAARAKQHRGEAVHVIDRQCAVDAVRRAELAQTRRHARDEREVRVRQHHALRPSGGARRVDDRRDVAQGFRLASRRENRNPAHAFHLDRTGVVAGRMRVDLRCHAHRVQRRPRLRVIADRVELARGQARVDGHRDRVERARREQRGDLRERVLGDDQHAVARLHAFASKATRAGVDSVDQAAPGDRARSLAYRYGVGPLARPSPRECVDANGGRHR